MNLSQQINKQWKGGLKQHLDRVFDNTDRTTCKILMFPSSLQTLYKISFLTLCSYNSYVHAAVHWEKAADWAETWPKFKPPIRWPGHPSSHHWLGWGLFAKAVESVVWKNGLAGGLELSLTSVPGEAPRITLMLPHRPEGKSLCLPSELWLQSYTGQTESRWVKYSTHKIFA